MGIYYLKEEYFFDKTTTKLVCVVRLLSENGIVNKLCKCRQVNGKEQAGKKISE